MRLLGPHKDHLALEGGALPAAADFCIAVCRNADKEHFILGKKQQLSSLLLALFTFHFCATGWTLNSAVSGIGKAIPKGLVIKESLQLSNHNKAHSFTLLWTLTAKIQLSSQRVEIWNVYCISGRKPGLQQCKRVKDLSDNQDATL